PREGPLRELQARTRRDDLRTGLPELDALQARQRLSLGHGVADAHEHLADPARDRRADLRILLLVLADLAEYHHTLAAGAGLDDARRHVRCEHPVPHGEDGPEVRVPVGASVG